MSITSTHYWCTKAHCHVYEMKASLTTPWSKTTVGMPEAWTIFIKPIPMFMLNITKNLSSCLIDTGLKLIPSSIRIGSLRPWSFSFTLGSFSLETFTGLETLTQFHLILRLTQSFNFTLSIICLVPQSAHLIAFTGKTSWIWCLQIVKNMTMFGPGLYPGYFLDYF